MRAVRKIDAQGLFVEDLLIADGEALPPACVEQRPPEGMRRPRWDGVAWRETAPTEEAVEAAKERKRTELQQAFVEACRRDVGEGGFYEVLGAVLSDQTKRAALTGHLARLGTLRKQVDAVTTKDPLAAERELGQVRW